MSLRLDQYFDRVHYLNAMALMLQVQKRSVLLVIEVAFQIFQRIIFRKT